jgi:hypothetical protein
MRDDEGVAADRLPPSLSFILASSSFVKPEPSAPAAAEPPLAEIAAPARAAAELEGHPGLQNEPAPPAGADPIAQDEPNPAGDHERIPQNQPGPAPGGEAIPQNEPSPAGGAEENSRNEPTASGRIAALSAPALVLALVIPWAVHLSAAWAAPIAGPTNKADVSGDGRSGPAGARVGSDRRGPFEIRLSKAKPGTERQSEKSGTHTHNHLSREGFRQIDRGPPPRFRSQQDRVFGPGSLDSLSLDSGASVLGGRAQVLPQWTARAAI